jgi:hypothetical protein
MATSRSTSKNIEIIELKTLFEKNFTTGSYGIRIGLA